MILLMAIIYNLQALTKYRRKVWSPVPNPTDERIPRPTQYAHQNNKDFNWLRDCKQLMYRAKLNVLVLTLSLPRGLLLMSTILLSGIRQSKIY